MSKPLRGEDDLAVVATPEIAAFLRDEIVGALLVDRAAARGAARAREGKERRDDAARARTEWGVRHEKVRAEMAATISRSLEEKRKLQLQMDRVVRRHDRDARRRALDETASRLRNGARHSHWKTKHAPPHKHREINEQHGAHPHMVDADHGEYLDHKHKQMMLAPDRQLWSHPARHSGPWRPAGGSPRPEDRLPFGDQSPLCSYSDADYTARLRGHKLGLEHENFITHNNDGLTVASVTGESMSRRVGKDDSTNYQNAPSATLATSAVLDQLDEDDRDELVCALAKIRTQFDLRGGRQYADTRGFDGRDMSPEEFRDQLRIQLGIRFSRCLVKKLFDCSTATTAGISPGLSCIPSCTETWTIRSCPRP